MSAAAVPGHERPFSLDELFFSTTDAKGVITSGNAVFARVAAIALEDLVGKAHNVIRHPDMPRAAFRVLWDELAAGRGVAAYVKNRAADGGFYWVMAFVVPIAGGYLSVRLKPASPLFAAAREVYREVLAVERAVERAVEDGDVRRRKASIAAGVEKVGELLAARGFASYQAFMHAALTAEVTARSAAPGRATESDVVVREAEGAALGAVAEILGRRSDEAEAPIRALKSDLDAALELLGAMGFRIAASKLMTEMVGTFLGELRERGAEPATLAAELTALASGLAGGGEHLATSMTDFAARLEAVESGVRVVDSHLKVVRALEVNGRVEGARLHDGAIIDLFGTVARQVADAREQLGTFGALRDVTRGTDARGADPAVVRATIAGAAARVRALAASGA